MQKYKINYWFYLSDTMEVAAEDENAAIEEVKQMIESSELANDLNKIPIGDSGVDLA